MPARAAIDLNSDLGEGFGIWKMGDDDELLRIISSANVACGYHAGDASIMRATCRQALELGVNVGAHVGYADRAGFGRREIVMTPEAVYADVAYQIGALVGCATSVGAQVTYVKPHGASTTAPTATRAPPRRLSKRFAQSIRRWCCWARQKQSSARSPSTAAFRPSTKRSSTVPMQRTEASCRGRNRMQCSRRTPQSHRRSR